MTPADLAAALGVDVESVRTDPWRWLFCPHGAQFWIVIQSRDLSVRPSLRCIDDNGTTVERPITTTLPAAVAHVRAMLAVLELTP